MPMNHILHFTDSDGCPKVHGDDYRGVRTESHKADWAGGDLGVRGGVCGVVLAHPSPTGD